MDNKISPEYDFGIRLKELRKRRNMTQREVAFRLHLNEKTISKYENNTLTPSLDVLVELALMYDSSLDYIIGIDKKKVINISDCSPEHQKLIQEVVDTIRKNLI